VMIMSRFLLIYVGAFVLLLCSCSTINALMPLPDSEVAGCLSQGTYLDWNTRQCAQISTPAPPILSPQQQAEQQQFEARVQARAAKCTTGTSQNCLIYAQQEELRIQTFCQTSYGPAAHNILGYKVIGWPAEMTAQYIAKGYPSLSYDLLIPLIKAGYTRNWESAQDFDNEAQQKCLSGNPF